MWGIVKLAFWSVLDVRDGLKYIHSLKPLGKPAIFKSITPHPKETQESRVCFQCHWLVVYVYHEFMYV